MRTFILRFIFIMMFIVCIVMNVCSQTYSVSFAYDTNGNRISRVITFTDDYRNDMSDTTDAECLTDNIDGREISIYPNPTAEKITLKIDSYNDDRDVVAVLYSPLGICMERCNINSELTDLKLGGLPSGTYILELSDGKEKRIWKIIKK